MAKNTQKRGGKRKNAGRKPIKDKKAGLTLYVRESVIENNGGEESAKEKCYEVLGATD